MPSRAALTTAPIATYATKNAAERQRLDSSLNSSVNTLTARRTVWFAAAMAILMLATSARVAVAQTTTSAPLTKVTVNGQVFYVLVPTDRGQAVSLPANVIDSSGGIAVLGASIDIDEGGNSNVGVTDEPQAGKNHALSRSVSLSHAVATVGVCFIWAALSLAGLA